MTTPFLDRAFLAADPDRPLLAALAPSPVRPVFVLGLHRSGTTYLYQLLADAFDVGTSTLYHVMFYNRLLWARQTGKEADYRADLAAELSRRGCTDRGIDGFPVGPDALEEYAFILRRLTRHWGYSPGSAETFDAMLRKLAALHDSPALLLKNPPDLATAPAIAQRYPDARFIFIRRDPVRILNSQFRNSFLYRRRPEPYLDLILTGIPLWRFNFKLMAALDRPLPDALYQRILIAGLRRSITGQLAAHQQAMAGMPAGRSVTVTYEELLEDPAPALARIEALIGVPRRLEAPIPDRKPRLEPLLPAVEGVAEAFRRDCAALGWEAAC